MKLVPSPACRRRGSLRAFSLALALIALGSAGCAHRLADPFPKKPYYGDSATGQLGNDYVPRETRRVQPWWPLF